VRHQDPDSIERRILMKKGRPRTEMTPAHLLFAVKLRHIEKRELWRRQLSPPRRLARPRRLDPE
jgi:hypothetical protein